MNIGRFAALPHEAGLVQRPQLRRDARLHRLHVHAAEVVTVGAHLVVEARAVHAQCMRIA